MGRDVSVALVGFGNVGRRLTALLSGPYHVVLSRAGVRVRDLRDRHRAAWDGDRPARDRRQGGRGGLSRGAGRSWNCTAGGRSGAWRSSFERVPADVLVEVTTLDPRTGEPASAHVRQALARGMHVVTANKGPVAFQWASLKKLAARKRRLFLHEGAVMDGTPVFNLVERCLRGRGSRASAGRSTARRTWSCRAWRRGGRSRRPFGKRRSSGLRRRILRTTSTGGMRR